MIGSVVNASGSLAFAGVGSPAPPGERLLDGAGTTLQALDDGRNGIDRIKSALVKLRATLQAARDRADIVPGRTALQPVVADVEQTRDKPTYVMVDGALVQTGTITVSLGTRPLVVGYQRANRAPLAVGDALNTLAATVATLVATVGGNGTGGFAADVSALLRSDALTTAVNRPDAAAIDGAIGRIDDVLARAKGLDSSLGARTSSAAQVDLGGLLLGAAPDATAVPTGGDSPYRPAANSLSGSQLSAWA